MYVQAILRDHFTAVRTCLDASCNQRHFAFLKNHQTHKILVFAVKQSDRSGEHARQEGRRGQSQGAQGTGGAPTKGQDQATPQRKASGAYICHPFLVLAVAAVLRMLPLAFFLGAFVMCSTRLLFMTTLSRNVICCLNGRPFWRRGRPTVDECVDKDIRNDVSVGGGKSSRG